MVLKALESETFEPLSQKSLKFVTYKTIFLTAIITFRRCSDLQSLRIDQESMRIRGLSKQDRQNHFGIKIHVPYFPERILLDPKRALSIYLEKTKNCREKLSALEKAKHFFSTVTISNWIVQTIGTAYSDDMLKVNAHSTSEIAPSWALL